MRSLSLLMLTALAVTASAQVDLPSEEIQVRPIAPPVEVLPYPLWMIVTAGAAAALVLALLVWGLVRWLRSRPAPPPLPPRHRALAALEALRAGIATTEPYPFSIEVSDVLRTFVTEEFKLSAIAQTSPEFLAATANSPRFSKADKELLALFLEKADLIKFARVHASAGDSERLLEQALQFVKGGVIA